MDTLFLYMRGRFLKLLGRFSQDLDWKNRITDRRDAFFSAKISSIALKQLKKKISKISVFISNWKGEN